MTQKEEAAKKIRDAISTAPKVKVKDGKVEVETPDGKTEEASEIQKHEFK